MDTEIRGSLGRNRRKQWIPETQKCGRWGKCYPTHCLISHLTSNTLFSESDICWVTLEPFSFSTNPQFGREIAISFLSHSWISGLQNWHLLINKNVFWKHTIAEFDLYSINFQIELLIQIYVSLLTYAHIGSKYDSLNGHPSNWEKSIDKIEL